mmetsp:Transcript_18266/g.36931  ORF Transcript_18266/g.36931 Transcript_18266/m.36931 type:complete len:203 (+) Transcript_18266:405-1013(+)
MILETGCHAILETLHVVFVPTVNQTHIVKAQSVLNQSIKVLKHVWRQDASILRSNGEVKVVEVNVALRIHASVAPSHVLVFENVEAEHLFEAVMPENNEERAIMGGRARRGCVSVHPGHLGASPQIPGGLLRFVFGVQVVLRMEVAPGSRAEKLLVFLMLLDKLLVNVGRRIGKVSDPVPHVLDFLGLRVEAKSIAEIHVHV